MKLNKIILRDSADTQFDDLIKFKKNVSLQDIYEAIDYVQKNIKEYTNEDIYDEFEKRFGEFELEYIGQYKIVEY
jgi:hypothetical protein